MAVRHQPQSEKHPYASPTTPGLFITFRAYLIELICLNVNPKLGPRFWSSDTGKYWGPKFRREVKGVDNVSQLLNFDDILMQTALIEIIKERNIKALTYKKTVDRVARLARQRRDRLAQKRMELSRKQQPTAIDARKNSTFVDTGEKNTLAKIREAENGSKETSGR